MIIIILSILSAFSLFNFILTDIYSKFIRQQRAKKKKKKWRVSTRNKYVFTNEAYNSGIIIINQQKDFIKKKI